MEGFSVAVATVSDRNAAGLGVAKLKARYKKLKGSAPRGSMASNATWLRTKIAGMERGEGKGAGPSRAAPKPQKKKPAIIAPPKFLSDPAAAAAAQAAAAAKSAKPSPKPAVESKPSTAPDAGDKAVVAALKARFKALKGSAPKGSQANKVAWLTSKITEMERAQGKAAAGQDIAAEEESDGSESDLGTSEAATCLAPLSPLSPHSTLLLSPHCLQYRPLHVDLD